MRRIPARPATVLAAALLALSAAGAAPAAAHDALESTTPARESTLGAAPPTVSITLSNPPTNSESLNLSIIKVTGPAGEEASTGPTQVQGDTISTAVAAAGPGAYQVAWRTVSKDGHPIEGTFGFTVTGGISSATSAPPATAPAAPAVSALANAEPVPASAGPDDSRGPFVALIAAAILAAAAGTLYVNRRRERRRSRRDA